MTAASRPRARKGEGELLREDILDAAEVLLVAKGSMDAVSIREIARQVGVSTPAIYLHFADKDQLFYAVCRREFEDFAAALVPALASNGSPLERLERLGRAYIRWGLEHWQLYPILFAGAPPESISAEELDQDPGLLVHAGLVALVGEAMVAGEIRSHRDPAVVATALWAAAHGAVLILIEKRAVAELLSIPPEEEVVDAVIEMVLEGVSAQGRARGERAQPGSRVSGRASSSSRTPGT